MQREHLRNYTSSMLLQEHAKHLLSLMDKTDASRNALEYFKWCQEVEDFTKNSTCTNNFQGQNVARSDASFTAGNTQKVNDSQDPHYYKQRQMKYGRRKGSTNSSIAHDARFDTSSSVPTRASPYNNKKGVFTEEAYLKRPETYRNHTNVHSSPCGSNFLPRTSKEDNYCLPPSPHQSTCSHRVSLHSSSSSSSSIGSCDYKTKSEKNWRTAGNDTINERLINCYQHEPAKHQYQTSNVPINDHSSQYSITSALHDLCDHGDFSLQNMEW